VVRGAAVNEKPSLAPAMPSAPAPRPTSAPPPAERGAQRLETPFPPSFPLASLALPAVDLIVLPAEDDPQSRPRVSHSIVPSMHALEIETRQRIADLEDEVPASLRFMQRMNALIVEARPSLSPRSSLRPPASSARPPLPVSMPVTGDTFLGAVLGDVLPGGTAKRTFRGTMADGARVLVKVFDAEAEGAALQLPAFQRGLRALSRLQGCDMPDGRPLRIAEVFAVATDLTAYVVRDYDNGAITNIVDVAITMQAGLEMFRSVCETVAALHREGVLVRSFKPNNILIDGLTPIIGEIDMVDLPALAEIRGDLAGYDSYVAPEELVGQGSRSPTADIYALGKLVDYLLTGHEPIAPVGSPPLIADRKGTPALLIEIVKRCLSRDPADRYQYVEDLLEDLQNFETNGAKATLQASIRPGALSRLKTAPSLVPGPIAKKSAGAALPATDNVEASSTRPQFLAPGIQLALGLLGLVLGALGLAIFYYSPATVDQMEIAQIVVAAVLGLGIWVLPAPKRRVLLLRLGSWAAAAAVVYLARPIQLSELRWHKDLRSSSVPVKEAAVERLARLGRRDFSGIDLRGARLARIDLGSARFKGSQLARADLHHAFLAEADFSGADLTSANLSGADLRGARLEAARGLGKASCDAATRFPSWLRCNGGKPRMQGPRPAASGPSR
jgi:hypothetical protein